MCQQNDTSSNLFRYEGTTKPFYHGFFALEEMVLYEMRVAIKGDNQWTLDELTIGKL